MWQPTGTRPVPVVTAARLNLVPPPPPEVDEMDASGRTEADSSRLDAGRVDTGRAGHWTHWTLDGRTLDGWTVIPGRWNRWVDTTWWTRTGDRRHGRRPGLGDHGGNARLLAAG
jgi:hypothetical protein